MTVNSESSCRPRQSSILEQQINFVRIASSFLVLWIILVLPLRAHADAVLHVHFEKDGLPYDKADLLAL